MDSSWRRCLCWTRISFIWSTTFSGIWDSKRKLRQIRLCILYLLHVLCQLYQLYVMYYVNYINYTCICPLRRRSQYHCDVAVIDVAHGRSNTYNMHKVMHIIRIISIISIIRIILIIRIIFRFVRILDWRITCGRTRGRWLPSPLITWAISFVLPCVQDGFHTSVLPTQRRQRMVPALRWWEKTCWWSPVESMLLLAAAAANDREGGCDWPDFCNEFQPKLQFLVLQ